ncbi:hypothetical protein BCR34DRAFT_582687 [Clohesyomyces aquaticus]|uniref:Uncharacterized protein n=1 Tax=Clohesyomyces aquaticus TaxID=1231657 RepID=A0A1Y2A8A4_9PLEO|nr:hypothetical protein BCR34DRAFT_582687 [Clohesyomyces aquaticus]
MPPIPPPTDDKENQPRDGFARPVMVNYSTPGQPRDGGAPVPPPMETGEEGRKKGTALSTTAFHPQRQDTFISNPQYQPPFSTSRTASTTIPTQTKLNKRFPSGNHTASAKEQKNQPVIQRTRILQPSKTSNQLNSLTSPSTPYHRPITGSSGNKKDKVQRRQRDFSINARYRSANSRKHAHTETDTHSGSFDTAHLGPARPVRGF